MTNKFTTDILICAKENSTGLYKKNIRPLKGKPLIYWTFLQAKRLKNIRNVYVSTDSDYIIKLAKKNKISVPYKRPKYLSNSKSKEWDVWKYHVKNHYNKKNSLPDALAVLPVTCPNRKIFDINKIISKFSNSTYDAMLTISETKISPYFNIVKKKSKTNSEIIKFSDKIYYNRQDLPKTFKIAPSIYIMKINHLIKKNHFFNGKIGSYKIDYLSSLDIDDINDFKILDLFFNYK